MSEELLRRIEFGRKAVQERIPYFVKMFGCVGSEWKRDGSRVTEADLNLSNSFIEAIQDAFPDDQVFSEELDPALCPIDVKPGFSWILDPIDGTNNFANGLTSCAISLGLALNGNPVYGYVYDHSSQCVYRGGPGFGILRGDEEVKVADVEPSDQCLVAVQSSGSQRAIVDDGKLQAQFKLRSFGSSTLHMTSVAAGVLQGVMEHGIKVWDIAASYALLKATGGEIDYLGEAEFPMKSFDVDMKPFGYIGGREPMRRAIAATVAAK